MILPTLYKLTSTGKLQHWSIETVNNGIFTEWGLENGKTLRSHEVIETGKNIGRSNETTPTQQAEAVAQSRFEKKLKKDYVRTKEAARNGESSELIAGGVLPMLAHRFDKHPDKILFPCYGQPKLDGHRCIAIVDAEGKCTLWTRTRKPIVSLPHIIEAIEETCVKDIVLDGELYNHEYKDKFEELTSMIKRDGPKAGCEVVHYHIYDMVSDDGFHLRQATLGAWHYENFIYQGYDGPLRIVRSERLEVPADAQHMFQVFLGLGYEGLMLRNCEGGYENKRSYNLQKVKQMEDAEFKIVGVKEGRGRMKGHGIFICELANNETVDVKMAGPMEYLKSVWEHKGFYLGKHLTIQFQGRTADGSLRFPVGLRLREDI